MIYSLDPHERAAQRQLIRDYQINQAEHRALIYGRSIKCGGWNGLYKPRHAGEDDGCKNDGTNCVCECHDGSRP